MLIGKSYWKGVVLLSVLYGSEVIRLRKEDIDLLQRQENVAMRRMLGAPRNAAIAGMRGDIGIGTLRSRIARDGLQYFRRVKLGENRLLSRVMENAQRRGSE